MLFEQYSEIVCHHGAQPKYSKRLDPLKEEFARVGILDRVKFQAYGKTVQENVMHSLERVRNMKGTVLFLEDDIRFLNDLDEVRRIFRDAPDIDCDYINFDPFIHLNEQTIAEIRKCCGAWAKMNRCVYGASCWSVKCEAAGILAESFRRHPEQPPDSELFTCHQDLRSCFSTKNVCVQLLYTDSMNSEKGWGNWHHEYYRLAGVRYSDYAVPKGYDYGRALK